MSNLDILHFEQLKNEVQAQFLKNNTPSSEDISKWKGIDITYFQEDLRKISKGNISEKSFYTYFKTSPVSKTPRIDMLNILSVYAGYVSWYDFKKKHLFENEILEELENEPPKSEVANPEDEPAELVAEADTIKPENREKTASKSPEKTILQKSTSENQQVIKSDEVFDTYDTTEQKPIRKSVKRYILGGATIVLGLLATLLGFGDQLFSTTFTYCFADADRNTPIQNTIEIKVIKENESPILYRLKPGECFQYTTKDQALHMEISSPFYENLEINRNLETAPREENIELKPDDYKMAVYYFSKKDISGDPSEATSLIKQKRRELENRISDDAVIYQVYDSDLYGIETLDKQKYITLVTTPTTSLRNLSVIEMKREKGKIVSIKFKINEDEENQ
ncbi:hypothetical protein [Chryseobacterium sp. MFBS3-17]|uniref:hypothetical protein n=1 Tax=Chryseobacterium sp. MFBS3-17 TaxID=2886689 RepID=UPI001D0F210D|nr:hypothetical protein [Chryseobacterium sp. MFBS3-17]MCC2589467.1 hypothetical protein [Chryseobacterium sp. MFBS3-17]